MLEMIRLWRGDLPIDLKPHFSIFGREVNSRKAQVICASQYSWVDIGFADLPIFTDISDSKISATSISIFLLQHS